MMKVVALPELHRLGHGLPALVHDWYLCRAYCMTSQLTHVFLFQQLLYGLVLCCTRPAGWLILGLLFSLCTFLRFKWFGHVCPFLILFSSLYYIVGELVECNSSQSLAICCTGDDTQRKQIFFPFRHPTVQVPFSKFP